MNRPDRFALVAGAAVGALGVLLLLDQGGSLELDWGWLGVALSAVAGFILLVSGLTHGRGRSD